MSNYLGIATVTEALRQLVQSGADDARPGAEAKVLRPPSTLSGNHPAGQPNTFAGVYLYEVTPNAAWRNDETPTRRSDGTLLRPTRAAFDLSYMISFYGDDNKLEPPMVLGAVLRRLSTRPVLTKDEINNAKGSVLVTDLANSDLEKEVEQVKFTMIPLSLEEMSKIWSIFFQTSYQLSVAYHAAVVFVDGGEIPSPALPVQLRNVYVRAFESPLIERVFPEPLPGDPPFAFKGIVVGDTLVISGFRLQGDVTLVRVAGIEVGPDSISPTEVTVKLDVPPFPADTLRAGVQGVQVVHKINMGTPETEHKGFESNVAAFVLRPTVTPGAVTISTTTVVDTTTFHDGSFSLTVAPRVGRDQRVAVLLNEFDPPANRPAYAYQFNVADLDPGHTGAPSFATVTAAFIHVASAKYLLRVQVDGAESLLEANANPLDPKYINPLVDLT
jgi:hypothetical protein